MTKVPKASKPKIILTFGEDLNDLKVRADAVDQEVHAVVVHKDCDDVEPAHIQRAKAILSRLRAENVPNPIACTPAWEMEAWWFLWPKAVKAAFPTWRCPDDHLGKEVGRIRNAKEELRLRTRPGGRAAQKSGYSESDAPRIAAKVREMGVANTPEARSASFSAFAEAVLTLKP